MLRASKSIVIAASMLFAAHAAHAQTTIDRDESDAGIIEKRKAKYTAPSPLRGLLAGESFDRQPMKSVYFCPGDTGAYNENLYTAQPTLQSDQQGDMFAAEELGVHELYGAAAREYLGLPVADQETTAAWFPRTLRARLERHRRWPRDASRSSP